MQWMRRMSLLYMICAPAISGMQLFALSANATVPRPIERPLHAPCIIATEPASCAPPSRARTGASADRRCPCLRAPSTVHKYRKTAGRPAHQLPPPPTIPSSVHARDSVEAVNGSSQLHLCCSFTLPHPTSSANLLTRNPSAWKTARMAAELSWQEATQARARPSSSPRSPASSSPSHPLDNIAYACMTTA